MAEELLVILSRNESLGFGFSLLGKPGLPPIIYNIVDDSPAAENGQVEVGDVILKINETDVNRFSTKEVLKCLRLSTDPVTLKIKRDPKLKATVRKYLLSGNDEVDYRNKISSEHVNSMRPEPAVHQIHVRTNGNCPEEEPLLEKHQLQQQQHSQLQQENNERLQWEPLSASNKDNTKNHGPPKFEAFMMTGEHILNISRVPQTTSIIPKHQRKSDNLRYYNSHTHHLRHQHNSVPNSPNEIDIGMKSNHYKIGSNSANTSPVSANKRDNMLIGGSSIGVIGGTLSSSSSSSNATNTTTTTTTYSATTTTYNNVDKTKSSFNSNNFVRTSRSEDPLQGQSDSSCLNTVNVDDDITNSLNTLLDTEQECINNGSININHNICGGSDSERIVWTYNAPLNELQQQQQQQQHYYHHHHKQFCHTLSNGSTTSSSHNSNTSPTSSSSPLHSFSPASPTSVSSSIMSSQSGSKRLPLLNYGNNTTNPTTIGGGTTSNGFIHHPTPLSNNGGDFSMSEAISNISSPDYHDDDNSIGIRDSFMDMSDHSDSDSTLLVSESTKQRHYQQRNNDVGLNDGNNGEHHRIVIKVKGPVKDNKGKMIYYDNTSSSSSKTKNEPLQVTNDLLVDQCYDIDDDGMLKDIRKTPSPQSSEDESDVDSLHSFHYSPKAVDLPSAIRLAKRLYSLDGFKKSDVSRHLCKNNDFSKAVAEEYLKHFEFENDTLDIALRKFLKQFSLIGETQEKERVLVHFSKRYLDCNPGSLNSQDAVHTLTCAIMLLNTDLHGKNVNRKMTCNEFIENLIGMNEGDNFPKEVLKQLYHAIKNYPLEWALDEENDDGTTAQMQIKNNEQMNLGANPFLDIPVSSNAIEYKKGYVMRKCCYEANAKKTPFHKRSWKMFYCTLRDLVLYLHKDENGFRKNQISDNFHNAIRIHHALATKASDYTKKQHVFRLQTADQAEYLFQTSDPKELQLWIDTINFVCASFSAPPLEAAVGSQKKFQRPLLPCSHTKLNLREQLRDHEERVCRLEIELDEHRKSPPERGSKSLIVQNYKEKEAYLNYEVKRYRTYSYILRSRMSQSLWSQYTTEYGINLVENSIGEVDEASGVTLIDGARIVPPPIPDKPSPSTNRYSYRQAIYNRNMLNGDADIG